MHPVILRYLSIGISAPRSFARSGRPAGRWAGRRARRRPAGRRAGRNLRMGSAGTSGARTGIAGYRYWRYTVSSGNSNFGRCFLGGIEADFCNWRLTLQHFSRSTRLARFCTAHVCKFFRWDFLSGFSRLLSSLDFNFCTVPSSKFAVYRTI